MFTDLPLDQLRRYRPEREEPDDFGAFWERTLGEARAAATPPELRPVATGMAHVDTFDVTFSGFAGQPVRAWLRVPRGASGPLPTVVQYQPYGGGRGPAFLPELWSSHGYAHLMMDGRGHSSAWAGADTPDGEIAPQVGGVLTRGVGSPETYYYRRLFTDAVRALDVARELPAVDPARIVVTGRSQGGAIAIAAAGLADGLAGVCTDVPFLCHVRHATRITDATPYRELADYLAYRREDVERVFRTISYVDGVNLAARATAPALFSVALMDPICPPSTVFAAYNHWAGERKDIVVWEYNDHDGGGDHQLARQLEFVRGLIG